MGTQARRGCEPSDWEQGQDSKRKAGALARAPGPREHPAGWGHAGWARCDPGKVTVAGDSSSTGERDEGQNDLTIQRVRHHHPRKHRGLWSPRKGAQSIMREQRGFLEEGPL